MSVPSPSPDPRPRSKNRQWIALAVAGVVVVGAPLALRGTGALHRVKGFFVPTKPPVAVAPKPPAKPVPIVVGGAPEDCATGVDPRAPITFELRLPNGPIDPKTISDDAVGLFTVLDRARVPAKVSIEGTTLTVAPLEPLKDNTNYRLHLLPVLKDGKGDVVKEVTKAFFTTSKPPANVAFEQVPMAATQFGGEQDFAAYTCTQISADHRLYASTVDGRLMRFSIAADGTLGDREVFATIQAAERGPRTVTGFAIDPKSDPKSPVIYVTHSGFKLSSAGGVDFTGVPDLSGKLSRITGERLDKIEDLITGLPRSAKDHAPNQPHFGPDGALYFPQPSNTAVGGPDEYWEMRKEHLLNATILRVDVGAFPPGKPALDARTPDVGGSFDPREPGSPLTIYASGLRMPYDLLWHSNGNLYSAVNGASSKGATPAGADVAGIPLVGLAEHDWFFKIKRGGYHGHPNPEQQHYVLNGGNPTTRPDFDEVSEYPVGTQPDSQWTSAIFDFGMHVSADGTIEYLSDTFGGALKHKVIVCRYNLGQDLIILGLDAKGDVNEAISGIPGLSFDKPLDVTEDTTNGNLYVCELGRGRITLARPIVTPTSAAAR